MGEKPDSPTDPGAPRECDAVTPTLREFEQWAGEAFDRVTAGMDRAVLERLNLGVAVSPDTNVVREPDGTASFVLGTFTANQVLGKQVELYYGSFIEVHRSLQPGEWSEAIEEVVRHELRHFLEHLQGRRDLAVEETAERLQRQWRRRQLLGGGRGSLAPVLQPLLGLVLLVGLLFLLARWLAG